MIDEIRADLVRAIDEDEYALLVWGKHAAECTPHELAEARRLMVTPFGGGFEPRPDPR